jgi:hypothetical protein
VSSVGIVSAPLFGALVDASSFQIAFLAIAVAPVLGWLVLRPLEGEEEDRADARAKRLATARP